MKSPSFLSIKIYWETVDEFWNKLDELKIKVKAKRVVSIISCMPEIETTLNCHEVCFEYFAIAGGE